MSKQLRTFLEFATETAYLAGRLTLGHFQTDVPTEYKGDDTPVTVADKACEAFIRGRIEAAFPTHAILGEEYGDSQTGASHRWVIDPIDGTKSFMRGVPLYGVLLGLEIEGQIEVGVAHFPAMGEMVAAATGLGCWWNGRPAYVSQTKNLSRAYVGFTDPAVFARYGRAAAWERLQKAVYYRVGWSDSYGQILAATGRLDIMLEPIMAPWDCGPFPVIFREAGGYFGDWQGNSTIYADATVSTSQTLLPQVLEILNG
ncbi:MAG: inositol monophosphatase family protein [Anaerolineae bacterium]|nr:inositol monophosphatase family protein [Anaerolineae bacterium]